MGLQAVYIAVTNDEVEQLQQIADNDELIEELEELQEDDNCKLINIDKLWDGLHFLLTGVSASEPIENNELSEFIVGVDSVLYEDEFVAFSSKKDVQRIVKMIDKINFDAFAEKFNPNEFIQAEIYPNIWQDDKNELFAQMKEHFIGLKIFYQQNQDLNIIVSIY